MDYLEKVLKKNGWSSLLVSLIFAIFGIILIINPTSTTKMISYILGGIFILDGIIKVINYLIDKKNSDFYNYDIAYGVVAILLGIIIIAFSSQLGTLLRIIIGIWIVYSSIIRLNLSIKLKYIDSKVWLWSLVLAIVMLVCGIYTIFTQNALIITMGYVIIIYSILDIIESLFFISNVSKISKLMK